MTEQAPSAPLAACPFCGEDKAYTRMTGMGYQIVCDGCKVHTAAASNQDAIAAWNRRAAVAECSSDPNTRPDRHPSPTRAEMVEARSKALEEAAEICAGLRGKATEAATTFARLTDDDKARNHANATIFYAMVDAASDCEDAIRAILTKADSESAGGEKA